MKISDDERGKIIDYLIDVDVYDLGSGYVADLLMDGFKGYRQYTDEELWDEVDNMVSNGGDDPETTLPEGVYDIYMKRENLNKIKEVLKDEEK